MKPIDLTMTARKLATGGLGAPGSLICAEVLAPLITHSCIVWQRQLLMQ